jgi:hypothetical protein
MMRSSRVRRLTASLAIAIAVGAAPASALGHQGGQPLLVIPMDHLVPGESFPVVAADLAPDAVVTIAIATADGDVHLGTVTSGPDGHFQTTLVLPSDIPEGYLLISARTSDGSEASTWVRIGSVAESPAPTPAGTGVDFWIDPSLLLLLGGLGLGLAAWFIRSRRAGSRVRPRS